MTRSPYPARKVEREAPPAAASRLAEIRQEQGALTLLIEGRPVLPVCVDALPEMSPTVITHCVELGVPLLRIRGLDLGWTANGRYDYADLDARLAAIVEAAPQAWMVLEVTVDAPAWWCAANPDECVGYAAAESASARPAPLASWASARWRGEAGEALSRLVRHVGRSAWGQRCIGFQVAAGEAGEWRQPHADLLPDVGPRMTERFRALAVEKYRRNEGLLKRGWDDPRASYDRIRCPGVEERRGADYGVFRSPVRSRRLLDYFETFYGAQNDAALHFAGIVKKASGGQALTGLSYATAFDNGGLAESGHGLPEPVLDSPDVDFIANAGPREGLYVRALAGSLALRGKLLFHAGRNNSPLLDAALAQTNQAGLILPATTDSDALHQAVQLATQRQKSGIVRKRAAQCAVILDPASAVYLQSSARAEWLHAALTTGQARELALMGAPYDVFMLADLFHPNFPNHKVYLCLDLFYLSEAERRRLDARLKRSEQTVAWGWAAGIAGEEGTDPAQMQKLTGLKVRVEMAETELRARVVEAQDPITWGYHPGALFGTPKPMIPTITVTDRASTRLGANSDNKTVLAAVRSQTWTALYCGATPIPARLLSNVLRAAGCHLYADTGGAAQWVAADAGFVAVVSRADKPVTLSLPGVTELRDAFTGKSLGTASDFELPLGPHGIGCYLVRPLARKKPI
jgi:hypothetical protein